VPSASYDPVQVTPLNAEQVEAMVAEAFAAFAAAGTAAELKQARLRTRETGHRSLWPTGRSAPCRRRPARTPDRGSAGPGVRSTRPCRPRGRGQGGGAGPGPGRGAGRRHPAGAARPGRCGASRSPP
jgi:hypothetical protein